MVDDPSLKMIFAPFGTRARWDLSLSHMGQRHRPRGRSTLRITQFYARAPCCGET